MAFWSILLIASLVRAIFFTGYFGSDEVTYTESAYRILSGDWTVSEYVGANRYGVNLPVAVYGYLLGRSVISAGLHSLICSVAEIALLMYFARRWFGSRASIIAGLLIACLPLHVHYAGRLMADSPLALTITASFLLFWDGELRNRAAAYAAAGVAAGLSFWVKPAAVFYVLVFLVYPLLFRRWNLKWLWMVAGFAVIVIANCLLFRALTGNFLFLFEALRSRNASNYLEAGAAAGDIRDSPGFYLALLFVHLQHTWLLGYLSAFAMVGLALRRGVPGDRALLTVRFITLWALSLILLLSLLLVSWKPLLFIPKQTNYALIFVAPLCLLAALLLARLRGFPLAAVLAATLLPALVLAGMHQGLVGVFTANSKAAVEFAAAHPGASFFGTTNVVRAAEFHNLVQPHDIPVIIKPMRQSIDPVDAGELGSRRQGADRYAIVDTETLRWGSDEPFRSVAELPACWVREARLPIRIAGAGWHLLLALASIARALPPSLAGGLADKLDDMAMPDPVLVFRIPPSGCADVHPN